MSIYKVDVENPQSWERVDRIFSKYFMSEWNPYSVHFLKEGFRKVSVEDFASLYKVVFQYEDDGNGKFSVRLFSLKDRSKKYNFDFGGFKIENIDENSERPLFMFFAKWLPMIHDLWELKTKMDDKVEEMTHPVNNALDAFDRLEEEERKLSKALMENEPNS